MDFDDADFALAVPSIFVQAFLVFASSCNGTPLTMACSARQSYRAGGHSHLPFVPLSGSMAVVDVCYADVVQKFLVFASPCNGTPHTMACSTGQSYRTGGHSYLKSFCQCFCHLHLLIIGYLTPWSVQHGNLIVSSGS